MICPIEYDFSCMVITLHSCARPVSAACLSAGEVWLVMKNFCCFLLTHRLYLCLRLTRSLWLPSLLTIDLRGTNCMTLYHSGVTADSKEPSGSQKVGLQLLSFELQLESNSVSIVIFIVETKWCSYAENMSAQVPSRLGNMGTWGWG